MLVGEVRWAITPTGCSWKLSGGSQWSSAPTKVSKNAQVLRARLRRNRVWSADSLARRRVSGRLIHHAIAGEANHRAAMGPATANAAGCESSTPITASKAAAGPAHMDL